MLVPELRRLFWVREPQPLEVCGCYTGFAPVGASRPALLLREPLWIPAMASAGANLQVSLFLSRPFPRAGAEGRRERWGWGEEEGGSGRALAGQGRGAGEPQVGPWKLCHPGVHGRGLWETPELVGALKGETKTASKQAGQSLQ